MLGCAQQEVEAHVQGATHEQHATPDTESAKTQTHSAKTGLFRRFSPNGSALWRPRDLKPRPHRHQSGGIALHGGPTRRRHAASKLHVVQNPHHYWCEGRRRTPQGQAAATMGGGGAWPDNESTRRAKLAARTASGRAAAHGHTKQPGPTARPDGTRNTSGATSNNTQHHERAGHRPRAHQAAPPINAYKNAHPCRGGRF